MNWSDIYKLPFKHRYGCSFWINSSNGVHSLDLLISSESERIKIVKILNQECEFEDYHTFCTSGITIFMDNKPLLNVRGWGHLVGIGTLNLSVEEATKVQNDFINYILKTLQNAVKTSKNK